MRKYIFALGLLFNFSLCAPAAWAESEPAPTSVQESEYLSRAVPAHLDAVHQLALNPSQTLLLSAGGDGKVRIWNTRDWRLFKTLGNHQAAVQAVVFSPSGRLAASGSADQTVCIWNADTWSLLVTITLKSSAQSLAFSPDDAVLAVGQGNGRITVWNAADGKELDSMKGHTGIVGGVTFSADGQLLFSISRDGARVWGRHSWKERELGVLPIESLYAMSLSSNGEYLAFGGFTKIVDIWNVKRWQPAISLTGHRGAVYAIAFSADGRYVATGSSDKTVLLWDAFEGKVLRTLGRHDGTVRSVVFLSSKGQVVSAGADRVLKVWDALRYYVKEPAALKTSSGETLATLPAGSAVTVEKMEESRAFVRLGSGASGWVDFAQLVFTRE